MSPYLFLLSLPSLLCTSFLSHSLLLSFGVIRYPFGDRYRVVAIEAETSYDHTYTVPEAMDVELLHYAVWYTNTTLPWRDKLVGTPRPKAPGQTGECGRVEY